MSNLLKPKFDFDKYIKLQQRFGCDKQLDKDKIDHWKTKNNFYCDMVDNEDILLQIIMVYKPMMQKFKIDHFLIVLRSNKYTYQDGIQLLGKKILDYMDLIKCYEGYVIYSNEFANLGYIDLIPLALKPMGLELIIDKENLQMNIKKVN